MVWRDTARLYKPLLSCPRPTVLPRNTSVCVCAVSGTGGCCWERRAVCVGELWPLERCARDRLYPRASASVLAFCARVVSIPVLVRSPPGAYRHPPPPSMVLACRFPKVLCLRGERFRYSGEHVVKGLLMRRRARSERSSTGVTFCTTETHTPPGRRATFTDPARGQDVLSAQHYRRLSASGLRAGGDASRLRRGSLSPLAWRCCGSRSASRRLSLPTTIASCHPASSLATRPTPHSAEGARETEKGAPGRKVLPSWRRPAAGQPAAVAVKRLHEKLHHACRSCVPRGSPRPCV